MNNIVNQNIGYMPANPYNWNVPPYNLALEEEIQKSNLRIQEARERATIDIDKHEYLDERRMIRRERMREYREGLYDDLCIENGRVSYVTKNSMFNTNHREVCNFLYPLLLRLKSSDGEEGVLELSFWIDGIEKKVLLQEAKLSNSKYLLTKIQIVGGEIYARKDSKAEKILGQLLAKLMRSCATEIIPANEGWNLDENGAFYFVKKGERTWNTVMKMLS